MFSTFYTTITGQQYIAKSMEDGKKLALTRGAFGNGELPSGSYPVSATALVSKLGDMGLTLKSSNNTEIKITTQFTNKVGNSVLPGFNLTEMGIFGKIQNSDGTDDTSCPEKLLFYGICPKAESDYIPATLTEFIINWSVAVSGDATIELVIDESLVYATLAEFNEMRNAELKGYYVAEGSKYSGIAGNYGIEVGKIEGNCKQITTTGKNLLDIEEDFSFSGTHGLDVNIPAGTYKISVDGETHDGDNYPYIRFYTNNVWILLSPVRGEQIVELTQTETKVYLYSNGMNAAASEGVEATLRQIMLSNDGGDYEPYSGGKPSPNPEYPQTLEAYGSGPLRFITHGRQLFDQSKIATTSKGGGSITNNGDGSFSITGSGALTSACSASYRLSHGEVVNLLRVGTLKLESTISRPYFSVRLANKTTGVTILELTHNNKKGEITQEMLDDEEIILIFQFYAASGETVIPGTIKPMLYQDGDGEWEEYHYQLVASEKTTALRSLPNGVCDTYENGRIIRRVGVITLDGSTNIIKNINTHDGNFVTANFSDSKVKQALNNYVLSVRCDKLLATTLYNTWNGVEMYSISQANGGKYLQLCLPNECGTTDTQLNAWLSANRSTVWFELAEPTIEEFEVPLIPSCAPYTTVIPYLNNDVEPTSIEWRVKNGVDPHPIGSVVITSTNKSPTSDFGGTWELIDKEFKCEIRESNGSDSISTKSDLMTTAKVVTSAEGHYLKIKGHFEGATRDTAYGAVADLCTITPSECDLSFAEEEITLGWGSVRHHGFLTVVLNNNTIQIKNDREPNSVFYAECGLDFEMVLHVPLDSMKDAACNKFYWKRTS